MSSKRGAVVHEPHNEAVQIAGRLSAEGRFADAERTYRAALEQDPSWTLGWQSLGVLLMENDQL
ncbi:MAG TPA: tetratricopeptide repeat protein, partial [Polyangia bacterium]|nr:tetratricopeptide repeat protein [Polyangia bacterium]